MLEKLRDLSIPHEPGQFVVAQQHLDLVLHVFREELNISGGDLVRRDSSPRLGLELVEIVDIANFMARLKLTGNGGPPGAFDSARKEELITQHTDLVLSELLKACDRMYGGWVPLVSKNQRGDGVSGTPDIGIGGTHPAAAGPPRPAASVLPGIVRERQTVQVGVLDTAIRQHRDFDGMVVATDAARKQSGNGTPPYTVGHGMFVAGEILYRAPNSRLSVSTILNDYGVANVWDVANAIAAFAGTGVSILNLSFCCFTTDDRPPLALTRALQRLGSDVVVVAAAGNHGESSPPQPVVTDQDPASPNRARSIPPTKDSPAWPAAIEGVLAVGSTDNNGVQSTFTPKDLPWIRVLAPGEDIVGRYVHGEVKIPIPNDPGNPASSDYELAWKTDCFDGKATWSGTSFAAAAVTGAIAQRVKPGKSAWEALDEVLKLPPSNGEGIQLYRYE